MQGGAGRRREVQGGAGRRYRVQLSIAILVDFIGITLRRLDAAPPKLALVSAGGHFLRRGEEEQTTALGGGVKGREGGEAVLCWDALWL